MTKFKIAILLLILPLFTGKLSAQYTPPKVEKSNKKEIVEGVEFYLHRVQERETLYSISKVYEVAIEQIIADNPTLAEGLKKGATIYIRVKKEEITPQSPPPISDPTISDPTKSAPLAGDPPIVIHRVRWFETLASIASKYGVEPEEIISFNSLKEGKVSTRQLLKIPPKSYTPTVASIEREERETVTDTLHRERAPITERIEKALYSKGRYSTIVAKLLLPLNSSEIVSEEWQEEMSSPFIEFYQGFLTALIDLKKRFPTLRLDLEVIDSDATTIEKIIGEGRLERADIIIGPIYKEELKKVLNYTKGREVAVVSPLDPESEEFIYKSPHFFQVNTPTLLEQRGVLSKLAKSANIVVIEERMAGASHPIAIESKESLTDGGFEFKELSYTITEGRSIGQKIENLLSENSLNQVVVASENEAFVSDVLRNLNLIAANSNFKLALFGTPRWRTFESIDISHYHNMELSIALQYSVDWGSHRVNLFLEKYRSLFLSEPSPYSFQGYDIASYFLGNMWKVGRRFLESSDQYNEELLQSGFRFIRESGQVGYTNHSIRYLHYNPDYSISVESGNRGTF
ncbi:MAG: LysM peptidoglycan-binding domain-containing protein [Bacteroidales bacterium]